MKNVHSCTIGKGYDALDVKLIDSVDPQVAAAISQELDRQRHKLELIASENIVSPAVMAVQGSVLTNKYAEGYPAHRFYGGCEFVDVVENLATSRARELFQAEYANVQPHSGSQANMAVYFAMLEPGDGVLGMDLSHGGHLTHGSPASFSGKLFCFHHYGVNEETGYIDYDDLAEKADRYRPKLIVAGASAYPRIIDFPAFARVARSVGAYLMVDMAHIAGLVAAGVHPSPIPHADVVTSTTHKTLRGPRGGLILASRDFDSRIDRSIFPGMQGGPLMHVIAAKAVAFHEALQPAFRDYQRAIVQNARQLAQALIRQGLTLVSGGTDNHMMLVDLRNLDITGRDAEEVLGLAGITVNKNSIPGDPRSPLVTSGIRIGTAAVTSRGMSTSEMEDIAEWIVAVLNRPDDQQRVRQIRDQVRMLCNLFPIYAEYAEDMVEA